MVEDAGVKGAIKSKQEGFKLMQKSLDKMNVLEKEYKEESKIILNAAVKFTIFLQENAILNTDDVFENYLGNLMRE